MTAHDQRLLNCMLLLVPITQKVKQIKWEIKSFVHKVFLY